MKMRTRFSPHEPKPLPKRNRVASRYEIVKPNPQFVALVNHAISEMEVRIRDKSEYSEWFAWASSWKSGKYSPADCVSASHEVRKSGDPIRHCLGQIAWGAKEACYDAPKSGWLVAFYMADAMIAIGAEFPKLFAPPLIQIDIRLAPNPLLLEKEKS